MLSRLLQYLDILQTMISRVDENLLDHIGKRLAAEDDIVIAIAFGSVATGNARPDSDADIAVLTSDPLGTQRRMELISLLADVTGRAVDLVDLRIAGVPITRSALSKGKRLVCKDKGAYADLMSRMLADAADFLPYRQRMLRERRNAWI
ncbi:MAG: nucleotidyltransferase domain-containing protein, partial [Aquisalimonadaceae bacterium]